MANPKAPLSSVVRSMAHGTATSAFLTSSAIFQDRKSGQAQRKIHCLHGQRYHSLGVEILACLYLQSLPVLGLAYQTLQKPSQSDL